MLLYTFRRSMCNSGGSKCVCAFVGTTLYTVLLYSIMLHFGYFKDVRPALLAFRWKPYNQSGQLIKYESRLNFTWLDANPVYKKFKVNQSKVKKVVTILIIVSTAPKRLDRRNGIRKTWWTQCVDTPRVKSECVFMTDYQGPNDKYFDAVQKEKTKHDDIYFQHVESGITFGKRFISHMLFAVNGYDFDYFLRSDDDQFVCLTQLLEEVPTPMVANFHWGWIHKQAHMLRADESMNMFSRDVIETFLMQQPHKILCHPLAGQMIAVWLKELSIRDLFRHDSRIHYLPALSEVPALRNMKNLCYSFMSIHGVYVNDMALLWEHRGGKIHVKSNLLRNSTAYPIETPFQWQAFSHPWKYEPKLCITNPKWDTRKLMGSSPSYGGKEEGAYK